MNLLATFITLLSLLVFVDTAPSPTSPVSLSKLLQKSSVYIPSRRNHLFVRELPGESCSSEGQWSCMTHSWQRCASGRWSKVMACANGTVCAPSGLTDSFQIQVDPEYTGENSINGNGRSDGAESSDGEGEQSQGSGRFANGGIMACTLGISGLASLLLS